MFTLIITGLLSAILFLMGSHTPSQLDQVQLIKYQDTLLQSSNTTLLALNASNSALPTPNAALADNITALGETSTDLIKSSEWLSASDVTNLYREVGYLNGNNTVFQPMGSAP